MRDGRGHQCLDCHATYIVATFVTGGTRQLQEHRPRPTTTRSADSVSPVPKGVSSRRYPTTESVRVCEMWEVPPRDSVYVAASTHRPGSASVGVAVVIEGR
jgi:hypothetical protein